MKAVAILGASGFIGTRCVEMLHLGGVAEVRPIVRVPSSLARLSRFALDARVADARDASALREAFRNCDVAVHSVAGGPELIVNAIEPVYRAAEQAGVRRLIYLSTASVHGSSPPPGTNEESPLHEDHALPYVNAKIRAERALRRLRERGRVELVLLRPGIVFGPRSFWVSSFADALLSGDAYLIDEGRGICNSIYVDNLVHAIQRALRAEGIDGEAFLLGDNEQVTWRELYAPIAEAMGFNIEEVPCVEPAHEKTWRDRLNDVPQSRRTQALLTLLPSRLRQAILERIPSFRRPSSRTSVWELPAMSPIQASLEMSLLYSCRHKLPHEKANRLLGYHPAVTFEEGCRRTVGWMEFAGYPVKGSHHSSTYTGGS